MKNITVVIAVKPHMFWVFFPLDKTIIYDSVSQHCFWRHTNSAYVHPLPNQTHLIQLISSLVRPETGGLGKGDIQNVACLWKQGWKH